MKPSSDNYINPITELVETVIKGGYCIGCGACTAVRDSPMVMKLDQFGRFQASENILQATEKIGNDILKVCPFSDQSLNEDVIGKKLFGTKSNFHDKIGYFQSIYAGYVLDDGYRKNGSSGGMASWIAVTLLNNGLIDGVIHVHHRPPSGEDANLFEYQLSTTQDEILNGAKSRYYPVEMSEMITLIRQREGNYLLVGIPCFVKSIRLLMQQDEILNERIKFCIGLICGHLKSKRFSQMLAWQMGINPLNLESIDFRTKINELKASHYAVTVKGKNNTGQKVELIVNSHSMYGTNWGLGLFKYSACDYCDDVVAETADISIGDAWLPRYEDDSSGTNIIIVRNSIIQNIIDKAIKVKDIKLENISVGDVIKSQLSGFRHRKEGLAYRLFLKDKERIWRPSKRVKADKKVLNKKFRLKQRLKIDIMEASHIAFDKALKNQSFYIFQDALKHMTDKYLKLDKPSFYIKVVRKLIRTIKFIMSKNEKIKTVN